MSNLIKIYSRADFKNMLSARSLSDENIHLVKNEYFISISPYSGPDREEVFVDKHSNVLSLYFDDVEKDCYKSGEPVVRGMIWAIAMTLLQADESIKFIKSIPVNDQTIHVHCLQGASRSVAFGLYLTELYNLNVEQYLIDHHNYYNTHVYRSLKNHENNI
jgi:predicted protein tyrosine phosphatase